MVQQVTSAIINAVNALFNWIFIFGKVGSPAFGVPGSGWSTCVARIYMAAVLAYAAWRFSRKHPTSARADMFNVARARRVLALGFPAAMQILLEIGVFSVVSALIGKIGAVPLAAHQIALNCASFTYMVPLGISSAAAVRVGNALGRGDRIGVRVHGLHAAVRAQRIERERAVERVEHPARVEALPDVPTLADTGVSKYEAEIFYGIVAPAKTPPAAMVQLTGWFSGALKDGVAIDHDGMNLALGRRLSFGGRIRSF